jgi:hypothetical protein
MAQENISAQLNDLLASRDFQAELLDKEGRPTDAENADIFTFDYVSSGGKNYGTMVIILDADNEMQVFYGDNLGRSMEGDDKTEFFDFVQHLHKFANMRRWTYSPKNINQVKYTMQGLAAIKEGLFEGYYGTRKVSYSGEPTEARLVIQHNRTLGEADARFRYVESLFIETADSERYRLQFKNLAGGRAMLEHVRQGGKPYDVRGCHITEMVAEIATLSRFNRASAGRVLEGVTAELVTEAQQYYRSLRENLKRMAGTRGYQAYFESWHPAETTLQEELVEDIKTLFVEQTLDSRIEAALPVLARLQQENRMKEADIFESWADNLTEGTWALPDTPEKHKRLQDLMSRPLIVGPDATNATEQLDDLVGDDRLFDYLEDLAARDASANVWDDTDVQARLGDLGIQLPGQPPEDNVDDVSAEPDVGADQQPPVQESRVKELSMDLEDPLMSDEEFETKYGDSRANMQHRAGRVQDRKTGRFYDPEQEFDRLKNSPEFGTQMRRMAQRDGVAEGSVYKKDQDLNSVSTQELEAFVKKHWGGGIPTWGQGESVKRAMHELRRRQKQGAAEGVEIVGQDSDLDQQVFTLNVDGETVSFTYWDYENNFQNPDIKDIYQQAREQLSKKLSPEQVKAVARSVFKSFKSGVAEGLPQTLRKIVPGYAKREIDKKMDAQKFGRTDVDKDANYYRYKKIQDKLKGQGVAEGDDPWGDQGRFAGDTRVDVGGTTLKKIQSGDTVSYFGEKARVVDLDYTNNYARITANGKTLNVKLSDLKRVGDGVAEAKMSPQQQNDFDRMRHGAMSRKEYDAKWKKPHKSDDQVIYGKKKQSSVVENLLAEYETDLDGSDLSEDAVADFLARGGEIQQGRFHKPRKSEKTDYGSRHIGGQRDAVAGKAGKTLGRAAATNFKGGGKAVVGEGGCNHTMEGEMCPEHGLAECGMHESQVQESQQHLADLARLKSLAHGK